MEPCNPSTDTSTGTKQITTVSENPWICLFFMKFLHIYYSWMMPPLKVGSYMVYRQHICQREQYILSELLLFCLCIFYSQNAIVDWLWAVLEIRLASQGRRLCSIVQEPRPQKLSYMSPLKSRPVKKKVGFFLFYQLLSMKLSSLIYCKFWWYMLPIFISPFSEPLPDVRHITQAVWEFYTQTNWNEIPCSFHTC